MQTARSEFLYACFLSEKNKNLWIVMPLYKYKGIAVIWTPMVSIDKLML